jgi:hypothetical protein
VNGRPLPSHSVRFVGERVHAACVNPAIVEVEQRTDGDGEVDCFVVPSNLVKRLHIFRRNLRRIVIHLIDKPEQRFVFFVERRILEILQHGPDQLLVTQKLRRDRGV